VDNPLAQKVIVGSPFDYVRLSAQDAVLSPIQSTLPVAFNAGEQDTLGTVTFIVPGNKTTLSCILLAQTDEGFTQASAGFQIP
jgi:hypothetical protein